MFHRIAVMVAVLLAPFAASAHDAYSVGPLRIEQPWSRALPPVSPTGAVYFSVKNTGNAPDRLIGASTPMAERGEFHESTMEGGIMRMRQVPSIDVSPGRSAELKPGGLHLMLLGLKEPLVAGKRFPLTLEFAHAGRVQVQVQVQSAGASAPETGAHGTHAASDSAAPAENGNVRRFDLPITGGALAADKRRIRVNQGERVELRWTSDRPLVLHLHGYDIEARVAPDSPATMQFLAKASGRFPVEIHGGSHGGSHGVVLYFEVYPK